MQVAGRVVGDVASAISVRRPANAAACRNVRPDLAETGCSYFQHAGSAGVGQPGLHSYFGPYHTSSDGGLRRIGTSAEVRRVCSIALST